MGPRIGHDLDDAVGGPFPLRLRCIGSGSRHRGGRRHTEEDGSYQAS
jgi:hypothetical protein